MREEGAANIASARKGGPSPLSSSENLALVYGCECVCECVRVCMWGEGVIMCMDVCESMGVNVQECGCVCKCMVWGGVNCVGLNMSVSVCM